VAFEALAMSKDERGRPLLLLADTGDPGRSRNNGVWLYTVREPDRLGTGTLRPQRYRLEYPDGPQNARTILVDPDDQRIYLVSMLSTGGNVYALPAAVGVGMSNVLTKVNPLHFVVQDGGFLPDGRVLLRGLNQAHLLAGIGGKRLAYLQLPRQANGPVAVVPGGQYILVAGLAPHSRVWRLKIPDIATPTPTPTYNGPTVQPVPMSSHGTLSGRAVGMASLAGLLAIAILGSVLHLRRRSRARLLRRPPV
jgi:hypothetical protein